MPDALDRCDALVLFGATGDLAAKMVFPALARLIERDGMNVPIVAVGHSPGTAEALVARIRDRHAAEPEVLRTLDGLSGRLRYVAGDLTGPALYETLKAALGRARRPLFYLAVPPTLFGPVIEQLAAGGLARGARIAVEKPFGDDLASARALERLIERVVPEDAVFRIDHFLGKDPLRNLAYMRAATPWLEPLWSAAHVRSVQVTMAEDYGIDGRGAFYERVGALRDVFQNHLLQVIALIAMEPVPPAEREAFGAARTDALRAIEPLTPADVVYGQYDGYREIADVAPESNVPTYLAVRLRVNTPRFAGVPFYVRAGKRLPLTATVASFDLTRVRPMHEPHPERPHDRLRFRLGPGAVGLALDTHRLVPGSSDRAAPLSIGGALPRDEDRDAYVNLLGAALAGDHSMSERAAGVTAAWGVVEPVLHADIPVHRYAQRSWGPPQADALLAAGEQWFDPPSVE